MVNNDGKLRRWREWHEREIPVKIKGTTTKDGVRVEIKSAIYNKKLDFTFPNNVWHHYLKENKVKLLDNITYVFTAHLPFLLKGNIRLEYNTGYPHAFSWVNQCFMRYLPAYWYLYHARRGTGVFPLLKTLLNSNANFGEEKDVPPRFPISVDENIILPFTFGKDSLLSYSIAKEIGLKPVLIFINDPVDEGFEAKHKVKLFTEFAKKSHDKYYMIDNPLSVLREKGEGWFGWELLLTSHTLLYLPFAYKFKSGYIVFSNEISCSSFFYDNSGLKLVPDYEQSSQATEELSHLTQSLTEGEVYTTTFLHGLNELAIVAILKQRYGDTLKYLMSCWSENEAGKNKRWCANCSKCARLYIYLSANGIDPIKDAGFSDNMLEEKYEPLYNVFDRKASGTGWDSFGLNTDEQSLAFYLTWLRGIKGGLISKFLRTDAFEMVSERFEELVSDYFGLHEEWLTPFQWKNKIDKIYEAELTKTRKEIQKLKIESNGE